MENGQTEQNLPTTEQNLPATLGVGLSRSDLPVSPVPSLLPGMWRTFTTVTCLELMKHLSIEAIDREYKFQILLDPKLPAIGETGAKTTPQRLKFLNTVMLQGVAKQFDYALIHRSPESVPADQDQPPITNPQLSPNTEIAAELATMKGDLAELKQELIPRPVSAPAADMSLDPAHLTLLNGQKLEFNSLYSRNPPYQHYNQSPLSEKLSLDDLLTSLDTTKLINFGNRKSLYYGDIPYPYGNLVHPALSLSSNPYLMSIAELVSPILGPEFVFNSALVNIYEDGSQGIPPHPDNEDCIETESVIVTVRYGAERTMIIRSIIGSSSDMQVHTLTLKHGDILVFTRQSQDFFDHGIPPTSAATGPSGSITLRMMRKVTTPPAVTEPPKAPRPPKKVLILSDSLNAGFDPYSFKSSIVCFKEPLKQLRNIMKHEKSIAQADVVIISAGINDMTTLNIPGDSAAHTLATNINILQDRYPEVHILLNAVSPVRLKFNSAKYGLSERVNDEINIFNDRCFNLGTHSASIWKKFRLFDIVNFGLAHLSNDGRHLTRAGQALYSKAWVTVALIKLGFRQGDMPLRGGYQQKAYGCSGGSRSPNGGYMSTPG